MAQALATLQTRNQNTRASFSHSPVLDHSFSTQTFDLYFCTRTTTFQIVCASLDVTWDGVVNKFPPFFITIKTRVKEIHWEDGTTGITNGNGEDVFGNYHIITATDVATAKAARTNYRAIQNSCALCKAVQISLTGDIKTQILSQISNVPSVNDVISLFFHMTKLTIPSALQISISAFKNILNFNSNDNNYHIPNINTKLKHLFVLYTTITRVLYIE